MRIHFHPDAESDLLDTHRFLQGQNPALAERFEEELAHTCEMLLEFPAMGRSVGPVRSVLMRASAYRVVYQIKPDRIFILAVAHQSRDEAFWYRRL